MKIPEPPTCVYCAGEIHDQAPDGVWRHEASGQALCPDGATTFAAPLEVVAVTGPPVDEPELLIPLEGTGSTRYVGHDPQVVAWFDEQGPPARALRGESDPAPRGGDTPTTADRATDQVAPEHRTESSGWCAGCGKFVAVAVGPPVHWSEGPDAGHVRAVFREIPPRDWDATISRDDTVATHSHGTIDSADAHAIIARIITAHRAITEREPVPTDPDTLPRLQLPPRGVILHTSDGWLFVEPLADLGDIATVDQVLRQIEYLHPSAIPDHARLMAKRVEEATALAEARPSLLDDRRPHSRACGMAEHPHGARCARDCPTCHGKVEL